MTAADRSVAIIGCGPRALWALESVLRHGAAAGAMGLSCVHVFGPDQLGAGAVYHRDQSDYLRLNVAAAAVDAWPAGPGPSFDDWREARRPGSSHDQYPARSLVGHYLSDQAEQVGAQLAARGVTVHQHHRRVERLQISGSTGAWLVDDDGPYPHVLVATGHDQDWSGALRHHWSPELPPLQPAVFPVQHLLARPELQDPAGVLIRGAALTGIDAVLAVTTRGAHGPLSMISRTGTMMRPKMRPDVLAGRLAQICAEEALDRSRTLLAEPERALTTLAAALLGSGPTAVDAADRARHQASAPKDESPPGGLCSAEVTDLALQELQVGVQIATGDREPDGIWALGQAWRMLYPDLVAAQRERLAHHRHDSDTPSDLDHRPDDAQHGPTLGWPRFSSWAGALERWAFGPPLVNTAHLMALIQDGTVRVYRGDTARWAAAHRPALVVDAVLPPAGIASVTGDHLWGQLRDQGLVRPVGPSGALPVDNRARVLDRAGRPIPGLSAVGRATEGIVLGTDTLIRSLHPEIEQWAVRMLDATAADWGAAARRRGSATVVGASW